jgi:hypothetical protein
VVDLGALATRIQERGDPSKAVPIKQNVSGGRARELHREQFTAWATATQKDVADVARHVTERQGAPLSRQDAGNLVTILEYVRDGFVAWIFDTDLGAAFGPNPALSKDTFWEDWRALMVEHLVPLRRFLDVEEKRLATGAHGNRETFDGYVLISSESDEVRQALVKFAMTAIQRLDGELTVTPLNRPRDPPA